MENKKEKTIIPSFCCLSIVDECMFKCKMCEKWKKDKAVKEAKELSFDVWEKAIYSLKELVDNPKELVINFGGGEVLMRKDILALVRAAADAGFTTNIATNGWLIDNDMAERISASGLSSINISLDSMVGKKHDEMRGRTGAAKRAFKAIDSLRHYSKTLEIGICTVIYDMNMDDIIPMLKWVNKNDALNWIVFMAAMQPNNTTLDERWYAGKYKELWPQDVSRVRGLIDRIMWNKWWGGKVQNPYHQLKAFKKYYTNPLQFVKKSPCNMDRAVHVSATGDIYCCFRWGKLGNIEKDFIPEMWHSSEANAVRDDIKTCDDNCHFLLNCFFEKDYPFQYRK